MSETAHTPARDAAAAARTSSQGTAAAHHAARVRPRGPAVRRRRYRLPPLPAAHDGAGVAGPGTPATERRIRQAKFPITKSLDSFDFLAIPTLNKAMVLELARCEFLLRKENVLAAGQQRSCDILHLLAT